MKTPTIDPAILEAAILGFTMQRSRIDDAIASLRAELEDVRPDRSESDSSTPAPAEPHKKRFSAAARKRMAAAQRKRWQLLKANKAEAAKKAVAKRKKANVVPGAKKRPFQVKAGKKVARKVVKAAAEPKARKPVSGPKTKRVAEKRKKIAAKPTAAIETAAVEVQPSIETAETALANA